MLTACEEELVTVHAHGEEGEQLVEEQGAVCEHGMGTIVLQVPPELHQHVLDSAGCGQSNSQIRAFC